MTVKRIDVEGWSRRAQYELFKDYRVPTYSATVRLDVTPLFHFHERGGRLFDAMLYAVYTGMSSVEELRLRMDKDGVVLYDRIDPVFTVAIDGGNYVSVRIEPKGDYDDFSALVRKASERAKTEKAGKSFADGKLNDFYFSCLPTLDFTALEQPVPSDPYAASVPMAVWGKMVQVGEKYEASLQICVHHALVDGMPLSRAFSKIQDEINKFNERSVAL